MFLPSEVTNSKEVSTLSRVSPFTIIDSIFTFSFGVIVIVTTSPPLPLKALALTCPSDES